MQWVLPCGEAGHTLRETDGVVLRVLRYLGAPKCYMVSGEAAYPNSGKSTAPKCNGTTDVVKHVDLKMQ